MKTGTKHNLVEPNLLRASTGRKHGFVKVRAERGSLTNCGRGLERIFRRKDEW